MPNPMQLDDDARFWRKVKRYLSNVRLARELVAMWFAAKDPSTPWAATLVSLGALSYFVWPYDVVLDFIGLFGLIDDLAVLVVAWANYRHFVRASHVVAADRFLLD